MNSTDYLKQFSKQNPLCLLIIANDVYALRNHKTAADNY